MMTQGLLARAAHYKDKGTFGIDKELELRAYAWEEESDRWRLKQKVYHDAINNFPPQKLPAGDRNLTRRDARFDVSVLIGGVKSLDEWRMFPVVQSGGDAQSISNRRRLAAVPARDRTERSSLHRVPAALILLRCEVD